MLIYLYFRGFRIALNTLSPTPFLKKMFKNAEKYIAVKLNPQAWPIMSELYLNPSSGKNLTSSRVDKKNSASKAQGSARALSESFKEVLKSVAQKSEGASGIRQDLVEQFKTTLANGTYEIKARELAEKMVQKIRDDKTRTII